MKGTLIDIITTRNELKLTTVDQTSAAEEKKKCLQCNACTCKLSTLSLNTNHSKEKK